MCDFCCLSADNSALLDTASGASFSRCLSDGGVAICLNSWRGTLVLRGSSCYFVISCHSDLGPYQHLLPYCLEVLLTYNHRCFYVDAGGVTTCTGCTGSGCVLFVYCWFVCYFITLVGFYA